jgi:hypothetical protein
MSVSDGPRTLKCMTTLANLRAGNPRPAAQAKRPVKPIQRCKTAVAIAFFAAILLAALGVAMSIASYSPSGAPGIPSLTPTGTTVPARAYRPPGSSVQPLQPPQPISTEEGPQ